MSWKTDEQQDAMKALLCDERWPLHPYFRTHIYSNPNHSVALRWNTTQFTPKFATEPVKQVRPLLVRDVQCSDLVRFVQTDQIHRLSSSISKVQPARQFASNKRKTDTVPNPIVVISTQNLCWLFAINNLANEALFGPAFFAETFAKIRHSEFKAMDLGRSGVFTKQPEVEIICQMVRAQGIYLLPVWVDLPTLLVAKKVLDVFDCSILLTRCLEHQRLSNVLMLTRLERIVKEQGGCVVLVSDRSSSSSGFSGHTYAVLWHHSETQQNEHWHILDSLVTANSSISTKWSNNNSLLSSPSTKSELIDILSSLVGNDPDGRKKLTVFIPLSPDMDTISHFLASETREAHLFMYDMLNSKEAVEEDEQMRLLLASTMFNMEPLLVTVDDPNTNKAEVCECAPHYGQISLRLFNDVLQNSVHPILLSCEALRGAFQDFDEVLSNQIDLLESAWYYKKEKYPFSNAKQREMWVELKNNCAQYTTLILSKIKASIWWWASTNEFVQRMFTGAHKLTLQVQHQVEDGLLAFGHDPNNVLVDVSNAITGTDEAICARFAAYVIVFALHNHSVPLATFLSRLMDCEESFAAYLQILCVCYLNITANDERVRALNVTKRADVKPFTLHSKSLMHATLIKDYVNSIADEKTAFGSTFANRMHRFQDDFLVTFSNASIKTFVKDVNVKFCERYFARTIDVAFLDNLLTNDIRLGACHDRAHMSIYAEIYEDMLTRGLKCPETFKFLPHT